jgi:type III pantothenate kinase
MLLAIDCGNTTLTAALAADRDAAAAMQPGRSRHAATPAAATADELEILLDGLLGLDGRGLADVTRIVISSVVPRVGASVAAVAARRRLPVLEASAATVPLPVRVDRPGEVGPDRLVNALAAARLHGTPAIVVDIGTATTVDAVGVDGAFLGGAIAAGPDLSLAALASRTAKLPLVELAGSPRAIGRDTSEALRSGAIYGQVGAVSELVGRMRGELATLAQGRRPLVLLTGGGSRLPWASDIPAVDVVDPDLTVRGLLVLAAEGRW